MKPPFQRVLDKVVPIPIAGCWIFTGALNEAGYGIVGLGGRGAPNDRAHRITYRHFVGEIPKGMFVCHRCDTPACCNPHHLFVGTNRDNVKDMISKGRNSRPPRNPHVVGSVHPLSKLKEEFIPEMRSLYARGWTQQQLAEKYGVVHQTISKVLCGKRFKHA
jgi:hypothetical protein